MQKRILVIDDEEPVRTFMKRFLVKQDYGIVEAANGREAIRILQESPVDLIMLDMNMPEMNGIDFLRYIRDKKFKPVPVLMVSGSTDADLRVECYRLGVYDFITKPEQAEVMLKRVENGLKIGEMIQYNEFIKLELLMAKKLQKYLFPESQFENGFLSIVNWSRPLSDIGGDLYDYVNFRNDNVIFFVGDVTGHSISAALYTAIVKMVFRNALKVSEKPHEIISIMNRELYGNLPIETFVTMFLGLVDVDGGLLHYTNAGHPKPMLLKNGEARELPGNDSFLGPIQNVSFQTFSVPLDSFDTLYVFTDGILDVLDRESNPRGKDMLLSIMNDASVDGQGKFLKMQERLLDGTYKITDDCTIMMVSMK